ncbi:Protein of unknown function [Pseudooceanicola antarcticus]|uniref:DUF3572 domain-containing protein n=1 Tax=Pseudooceanicola antarcticus TaxID=1247613 RepID=A0A285JD32_9RHOB|nr:DUF3572 domain-containing protein [Pseudooceanicola antarcticus]PJE30795.1 DUF3572 domain-containing protein [Pseudooceanicola antarcticus]SNY57071.1 Protein of unknown function [Pseudooceanicola antarcticus]
MSLSQTRAEEIALACLGWLAANEDLLPVFMGASGVAAEDLRASAEDPHFLGAVLDFLLMDDAWVMGFCQAQGLDYDVPYQARQALPGGEQVHWT